MPYVVIQDFRSGLDRRKASAAAPAGSLQTATNLHITRGGEIQKRLAFVPKYQLPPGATFGMAGANGALYVFSSTPQIVPAGVTCQVLAAPNSPNVSSINAAEFFNGQVFASANFSDGTSHCFNNGTLVGDWEAGSGATVAGQRAISVLTVKNKVYATFGSLLNFSTIATPTSWQAGSGYGYINMSNQSAGSEALTGLGRYQGMLAVFSRRNTQIWYVDPDPLQNAQKQVIPNIGTFAPKSIENFGDIDVIFLSDTGIRSLKVRDASNQAGVSDIGTPVDDEIISYMRTLPDDQKASATAVLEPIDGRYILALGQRNYVYSYYPSSNIAAWSRYDPGFVISDWVSMNGQVWARSGDTIYLLGGDDGQTYDASIVTVELPYLNGQQLATWKAFTGIDMVSQGEWQVFGNTDPDQPDIWSLIAIIADGTNSTVAGLDIDMVGDSPLIKLKFVNSRPGPAKISQVVVHYRSESNH